MFLRAKDPGALAAWYEVALGIGFAPDGSFAIFADDTPGAVTVFSLFGQDETYIGEPGRQSAMVNFRVDDLDGVIERIRACGSATEPVLEEGNGRFSWSTDPEGNRIEIWEPSAPT